MQLQLFSEGMELTSDQKEYIWKKIMHLEKFSEELSDDSSIVRVDVRRNKVKTSDRHFLFQVTLFVHPVVIRAEDAGVTLEEAVDITEAKLRKQIERYKTKQHRRTQAGEWIPESTLEQLSDAQNDLTHGKPSIGKRKKFADMGALHEDEAIEQLELLGHPFYIFDNRDTGFLSVAYKREDGSYGVIELDKWNRQ